jgi:hypothetical protein
MSRKVFVVAFVVALLGAAGGAPRAIAAPAPVVSPSPDPAWPHDGPDPDVLRVGSTYYGYTTGTTWGNHIGVLTSNDPASGWRTITGQMYGSSALPNVPKWQQTDTQTSPGVFFWAGRYVMFYNAVAPAAGGKYCLSVATSTTPTGPFTDNTNGSIMCQIELGGSIDPHPFVDWNGKPFLYWKNNDGSSPAVSSVWVAPLTADGLQLAGQPQLVMSKDSANHPWQNTVDDPQMILIGGAYYLFFTGGDWQSADYAVGYAVCQTYAGPCTQPQAGPILSSYGSAAGPGGGMVFDDAAGHWWMVYAAWLPGCTDYRCGGERRMYTAPMQIGAPAPPPRPPTRAVDSAGYVLDGWGGLHRFHSGAASAPPAPTGAPYWPNWDIARGLAAARDGSGSFGYLVDGWGGLHGIGFGSHAAPAGARGAPYWPNWDIARGVALIPGSNAGYILDGWGGLHPFNGAPAVTTSAYWPGWDIARGVTMAADGRGGYVVDGYGGTHAFAVAGRAAPGPTRLGPYWPGWDIGRGIALLADGSGGYVLDGWGGLHGFDAPAFSGGTVPAPPPDGPYWPGWSIARGVTTL